MKNYACACLALFITIFLHGQAAKQIVIETKNSSLVLTIAGNQRLLQSYLGRRIGPGIYESMRGGREVYLTSGMENQSEPAIRIIHADGNPSLQLNYISHTTEKSGNITTTKILLKDPVYPVEVTLFYKYWFNEDIISTWTEIKHQEKKPLMLTAYASSLLHFNSNEYWLTQFHGDWAREVNMEEEKLTNGIKIIESKLGTRTNFYQTQAFFLSLDHPSTETEGELIAGTLAWTGNFQYLFEIDQRNGLRVRSGINPYASEYYPGTR